MNWIARFGKMLGVGLLGLIAGCGGGGGSGGAGPYTITLRSDVGTLPLNIAGESAQIGGRYTTTLYVESRDNAGRPIPDGTGFACSLVGGFESGALYYLDGNAAHETTVTLGDGTTATVPTAYRAITLNASSGNATFHYHATDIAGTATIRCTVSEPSTNVVRTVELNIQVGGPATGKVSQIVIDKANWTFPGYLFVQGVNSPNQGQLQASLVDEAGQAVPNSAAGANNLLVEILPQTTATGATLRGINKAGNAVAGPAIHTASINGQAQFTLVSGNTAGLAVLRTTADRADNNVGNGIQEAIYNVVAIPVYVEVPVPPTPPTPIPALEITTASLPAATANIPYVAVLQGTGGVLPYTWSMAPPVSNQSFGLPMGLVLDSSGLIYGTPIGTLSGTYNFVAQIKDSTGTVVQKQFAISFTGEDLVTPVPVPALAVSPGSGTGVAGGSLTFVVTGGQPGYAAVSNNASVATASMLGNQVRVNLIAAGTTTVVITDNSGQAVTVTVTVTGGSAANELTITPSVGGTIAIGQTMKMMVSGGVPPYTVTSTNPAIGTVTGSPVGSSGGTFTFTPVSAGSVVLIISDNAGTIKTTTIGVSQPGGTLLAVLPNSASWTLGASCDGSVAYTDFVVYGGIPPYTAYSTQGSIATVAAAATNGSGYTYFRVTPTNTDATGTCDAYGAATIVIRDSVNATISVLFTTAP